MGKREPTTLAHGHNRRGARTRTYESWVGIKSRCTNPANKLFKHYGGRGIGLSPEWLQFSNFLRDMGECPAPNLTVERVDNSRGYGPDNCRWATMRDQTRNKRNNVVITINNRTQVMTDWCLETGVPMKRASARIIAGWDPVTAVTMAVR